MKWEIATCNEHQQCPMIHGAGPVKTMVRISLNFGAYEKKIEEFHSHSETQLATLMFFHKGLPAKRKGYKTLLKGYNA